MAFRSHIIGRQTIDLTVDRQADAFRIQEDISWTFRERLIPRLEEMLDQMVGPDAWVRLDRVEIDLGLLDPNRIEESFTAQFMEKAKAVIEHEIRGATFAHPEFATKGSSLEDHSWNLLIYFLQRGSIPWWGEIRDFSAWEQKILAIFQSHPGKSRQLASLFRKIPNALTRWIFQFSDPVLEAFAKAYDPVKAKEIFATNRIWESVFAQVFEQEEIAHSLREIVWRASYEILLENASPKKIWENTVVNIVKNGPANSGISIESFIEKLLVAIYASPQKKQASKDSFFFSLIERVFREEAGIPETVDLKEEINRRQARIKNLKKEEEGRKSTLQEADEGEYQGMLSKEKETEIETTPESKLSTDKEKTDEERVGENTDLSEMPEPQLEKEAEEESQEDRILTKAERERIEESRSQTGTEKELEEAIPSQEIKNAKEEKAVPDLQESEADMNPEEKAREDFFLEKEGDSIILDSNLKEEVGISHDQESRTELRESEGDKIWEDDFVPVLPEEAAKGIYIHNAGVILLHPFLGMFFEKLNLVRDQKFIGEEERQRAIHLIQYLASGEEGIPEYQLALNKILCAMPLDIPVKRDIILTSEEKAEAENLLSHVVSHWKALKNTSPDGLRFNYLMREGKLIQKHDGWRLIIEKKTQDILLNQLPWGISMIQLSWMQGLFRVEWN